MTTSSLPQFQLDLKNFAEKLVPEEHAKLVKKIAFELFKRIVEKTPVDTGRARANWSIEVGPAAPGDTTINVDPDGTATINRALDGIDMADPSVQIIWLYNNLPYIEALENGHSQQAPVGMVAGSLNEIQHYIDQLKTVDFEIKNNR